MWSSLGLQLRLIKAELAIENVSKLNPICFEVSLWSQKRPNAGYEERCMGSYRKCWEEGREQRPPSAPLVCFYDVTSPVTQCSVWSNTQGESRKSLCSTSLPQKWAQSSVKSQHHLSLSQCFVVSIDNLGKINSARSWPGGTLILSLHAWVQPGDEQLHQAGLLWVTWD